MDRLKRLQTFSRVLVCARPIRLAPRQVDNHPKPDTWLLTYLSVTQTVSLFAEQESQANSLRYIKLAEPL